MSSNIQMATPKGNSWYDVAEGVYKWAKLGNKIYGELEKGYGKVKPLLGGDETETTSGSYGNDIGRHQVYPAQNYGIGRPTGWNKKGRLRVTIKGSNKPVVAGSHMKSQRQSIRHGTKSTIGRTDTKSYSVRSFARSINGPKSRISNGKGEPHTKYPKRRTRRSKKK
jgi:hypothetical protein